MRPDETVIFQDSQARLTNYYLTIFKGLPNNTGKVAGYALGGCFGWFLGGWLSKSASSAVTIPLGNISEIKMDSQNVITVVQKIGDDYQFAPGNWSEWYYKLKDITSAVRGEASSFSGRCAMCDAVLTSSVCKKCGHHNKK